MKKSYIVYVVPNDAGSDKITFGMGKVVSNDPLTVVSEPDSNGEQHRIVLTQDRIVADLGEKPFDGTAFGFKTSVIFRAKKDVPNFGTVYFYCVPEKDFRVALKKALPKVKRCLASNGVAFLLDDLTLRVVCSKAHGSYEKAKTEDCKSVITISTSCPEEEIVNVLLRMVARHALTKLPPQIMARWMRFYAFCGKPMDFDESAIQGLVDFISRCESVKEAKAEFSEEDQLLYRLCMKGAGRSLHMSAKELMLLLNGDDRNIVFDAFPKTVRNTEYTALLSQGASKNYREAFVEVMSNAWSGLSVPKSVKALVADTNSMLSSI